MRNRHLMGVAEQQVERRRSDDGHECEVDGREPGRPRESERWRPVDLEDERDRNGEDGHTDRDPTLWPRLDQRHVLLVTGGVDPAHRIAPIGSHTDELLGTEEPRRSPHPGNAGRAPVRWATGDHSSQWLPLFAFGPGAERFTGVLDNTEVGQLIAQVLGLEPFPQMADFEEN